MLSKTILVWSGILLCALPSVRSFNHRFARLVSSDESGESRDTLGQDWEENRGATITLSSNESDDAATLSSIDSDATALSSIESNAMSIFSIESDATTLSSIESNEMSISSIESNEMSISSIESDDAITISSDESDESRIPLDQEWETLLDDLHLLSDESDESRIPLDQEWQTLLVDLHLLDQVLGELKEVPLESSSLRQEKLTQIEHQMQELSEVRERNTNPNARKTLRFKH